jgi:hypothetical protein
VIFLSLCPPKQRADLCKKVIKPIPVNENLFCCHRFSAHGPCSLESRRIKNTLPAGCQEKNEEKISERITENSIAIFVLTVIRLSG